MLTITFIAVQDGEKTNRGIVEAVPDCTFIISVETKVLQNTIVSNMIAISRGFIVSSGKGKSKKAKAERGVTILSEISKALSPAI